MIFDLHFFLGNVVAAPLGRAASLAYGTLLVMMAFQAPALIAFRELWVWYAPFLLLLLSAAATVPTAANLGFARMFTQYLLVYYVLAVASMVFVRSARHALPIIWMMFLQFAWWAIWAGSSGLVWWHPLLANYDGFGGLMVSGVGMCFWFGVGSQSKRVKLLLFALAGYCVMGVVASYARGAFLSLVALAAWVWFRSPRKMLTTGGIALAAVIVVVAASAIFDSGFFWSEIRSAFEEGAETGTGAMRWALWTAAWRVFLEHPVLGVGAGNFGVFAAGFFKPGEIPEIPNPGAFYGMNLHNAYFQILSELGIVGIAAFLWLLVDFQRRNKALRQPEAIERWRALTGGTFDLRYVALAVEAANVANLLSGLFYASLYGQWFYVIWALNRVLWAVTASGTPTMAVSPRTTRTRVRRSRPG
ncbi:MAG TPA: O-antigen ligase family protein [Gemmatimonadales bacterium]|nr:O-antigen ligase family protein [Gemmatimonadales bacterium]